MAEKKSFLLALPDCKLVHAEADVEVHEGTFLSKPAIVKWYKHEDASSAASQIKQEVKGLLRCRKLGITTPAVLCVDLGGCCLALSKVEGPSLDQLLQEGTLSTEEEAGVLGAVGKTSAVVHDWGLVHGALYARNIMLPGFKPGSGMDPKLTLIGFGGAHQSTGPEDKASDLVCLESDLDKVPASGGADGSKGDVSSESEQQVKTAGSQEGAQAPGEAGEQTGVQGKPQQAAEAKADAEGSNKRKAGSEIVQHGRQFTLVVEAYRKVSKQWSATFNRIDTARIRARKKAKTA